MGLGVCLYYDFSKLDEIAETSIKLSNLLKGEVELVESEIIQDKVATSVKIPVSDVSIEKKKEVSYETSNAADFGEIVSIIVNYSDSKPDSLFLNTESSIIEQKTTTISTLINSAASNGDMIQFGHVVLVE